MKKEKKELYNKKIIISWGIVILIVLISISIIVSLINKNKNDKSISNKDEKITSTSAKENNSQSILSNSTSDWKTLYYKKIQEIENTNRNENWDSINYAIFNIDNASVPELAIYYVGCEACKKTEFYTIKNNSIIEIGTTTGNTTITLKDNTYYSCYGHSGIALLSSITMKDDKLVFKEVAKANSMTTYDDTVEKFLKGGKNIVFKKISEYEYIKDVNQDKETNENTSSNTSFLIEYGKKYINIDNDPEQFADGMYIIFYENNKVKMGLNYCHGIEEENGIYHIEKIDNDYHAIIEVPNSTIMGEMAFKITDDGRLTYNKSYNEVDYACGFSREYKLS